MRKTVPSLLLALSLVVAACSGGSSQARTSTDDSPVTEAPSTERTDTTEQPSAPEPATEPESGPASRAAVSPTTPAEELAAKVRDAAGGDAFEDIALLEYTFVVGTGDEKSFEARHRWDRVKHRDLVRWNDEQGRAVEAMVDLDTKTGWATLDGEPVDEQREQKLVEQAHARWINDTYWLAMPLKLLDPGVSLTLEEPREIEGKRYEVLRLEFDDVGLTPGDTYWVYVDPETHRVTYWDMKLEGQEGEPRRITWEDYRDVGGLTLAFDHVAAKDRRIWFEDVEAVDHVERPEEFLPPSERPTP